MSVVSELREGMDNLADAVRTLAGAMCQIAAGMNVQTVGDQRNMAAVFHEDARTRFADVHRKLDPKLKAELEAYVTSVCKGKAK